LKTEALKIAMISMHSSPVGELGTRHTGGMSVYIEEVARRLGEKGRIIDIFTRLQQPAGAGILQPFPNVRIIHLKAGPPQPLPYSALHRRLPEFLENLEHFRSSERIEYDIIHSHYYLSGQIGHWARQRWGAPHVLTFHTLGVLKNRGSRSGKEPDFRIAAERRLAVECDLILAATEREKRHLIELYGASPQNIRVTPCGVDLERFQPSGKRASRARLGLSGEGPVVLYVGRFDPVKGVDRLLAATALLRREIPVRVILVGGGEENTPENRALHAICSNLSIEDCVAFAGRKTHDALPDYYRAADVLVLPSYYESFGLVVLEALACGTPVVAMRVGVVEDIVRNGVNGWAVSENSPEALAEGIRRALDPNIAPKATAESIRATVESYDWSFVADSIDDEYGALLGRSDSPEAARMAACRVY
jgi:D-inositol-3-phosphate glycosyltransferase